MRLKEYLQEIGETYAAIARRIEELIEVLNTAEGRHGQELAKRIIPFLKQLDQSVEVEERLARRELPKEKAIAFLRLCRQELDEIKELKAYIALAGRKPTPEAITKINALYRSITKNIAEEKKIAA